MPQTVPTSSWLKKTGRLTSVRGRICAQLDAGLGELVEIRPGNGARSVLAEVIGFDGQHVQLMPFQYGTEFRYGDLVIAHGKRMRIPVGFQLLGRVINAVGQPIDEQGQLLFTETTDIQFNSPAPLRRPHITRPFVTGIRAIDGLLSLGQGQRVGLFAGSGVGKSTLLGNIARHAESDVNVLALVGERGREVRPFVESNLGPQGLSRSIVIVSTSDDPPLARVRACEAAILTAGWFRAQGKNVLLMIDSLTRLSHAQRELGLLLGEPPTSRGYTPSVFQQMAHLMEQLGSSEEGAITGILTVLVDGDDMNEPIADTARSILDGHIVLDRRLAYKGHFPAIDILSSVSRLFHDVTSPQHQQYATRVRELLAKYYEVEDMIQIGAYKRGQLPQVDLAVDMYPRITDFLRQSMNVSRTFSETWSDLVGLNLRLGAEA